MVDTLEQLKIDLLYLAKRQKVIEDAVINLEDALLDFNKKISEWSEFMVAELLKQGIQIHKYKRSHDYFKESLKDKFKADFEKFETLFGAIKPNNYLYNITKEDGK